MLIAAQALWFYTGKLFWPTDLAVIYPRWDINAADPLAWAYVVALVVAVVSLWFTRRRVGRGPLACIAFFIITLAPVLGFIDFGYMQFSFVADRYQYLAGIGIITLFVGAGASCVNRLWNRPQAVTAIITLPLLLLLGALTWKQSGIYRDELTFFNHIISLNPDARRVYQNLAAELNSLGRSGEALAAARTAVQKDPDSAETRTTLGLALMELEQYEEAEKHLRRALDVNPRHANAWQNLADLMRRQRQYEAALEMFRKALKIHPSETLAHAGMGHTLFELDRHEEAVASIRRALSLEPDLLQTHEDLNFVLGWALHKTGRSDQADRYLSNITGKAAQSANDFLKIADIYRAKEEYEQAVETYRYALDRDPAHARAHAGLGDALFRLKRYQEAIDSMQHALALQPDQPSAPALHYLTGESLQALNKPEQALEHYENALRLQPKFDDAARHLAALLFDQKRYQEALEIYQAMLDRNPEDASTHANIGSVLFMLGRPEEALEKYEQALSLNPTHENALANREQVRRSLQEKGK